MIKIITFPRMGKEYTKVFEELFKDLDFNVIVPPPISEKTIKFGVKHSSDMMCYPYKICLGNFYEALEKGANTLLIFDSKGQCRFRHYWKILEHTLKHLNYDFEIYPFSTNLISIIKKLNPSLSYYRIFKVILNSWKKLKIIDKKKQQFSKDKINVGIIGEIYTSLVESVNYNVVEKLNKFDVNVYSTVTLTGFLKEGIEHFFKFDITKRKYKRVAKKYLNGPLGGHGFENIYNLLWLIDNNIDGVIHLLPLSCMPETTVEPMLNKICQDNKIPLLRLVVDETSAEANVNTRIETFVELIKRKKWIHS